MSAGGARRGPPRRAARKSGSAPAAARGGADDAPAEPPDDADGARRAPLRRERASQAGLAPAGICRQALDVVERLQRAGHESYIVGGGVRDLLLGETPKDFDVATDARPEQVRALFSKCRLIGRRFRIVHIYGGGKITEVATFRADTSGDAPAAGFRADAGRIVRDNVYGSLEEDALRRDFTINSIYYDPFGDRLVSHDLALDDVRARCLRTIGDAARRYREDPVRMLRAVRFLARPGLVAERETGAQIARNGALLGAVPPARLFDQLLKLFHGGAALKVYRLLREHHLFGVLFPLTMKALEDDAHGHFDDFLQKLLACTDERVNRNLPSTPAFVLAGLWWLPVRDTAARLRAHGVPVEGGGSGGRGGSRARDGSGEGGGSGAHGGSEEGGGSRARGGSEEGGLRMRGVSEEEALQRAVRDVAREQSRSVSAPMRLVTIVREILVLQRLFTSSRKKDLSRLLTHPRFRAACNFFTLLEQAGLADRADCPGWARIEDLERKSRRRDAGGRDGRDGHGGRGGRGGHGKGRRRNAPRRRRRKPAEGAA